MPKQQGARTDLQHLPSTGKKLDESDETPKPKLEVAADMGFNKNQVTQFQKLALLVEEEIAAQAKARQAEYHGNQYQSAPEDKCPQVQTPQEKNKIDRQNKTNYQLAKMAGVSHDTIAKVEKIEKQAAPEKKAAVTSSLTTYLAISEENRSS